MYLIEKSREEIKRINEKSLFQKADLSKKYREKSIKNSLKIKNYFLENYNQFLNNTLSSVLTNIKEDFLELKNRLVKELKDGINQKLKERVSKNREQYINFVLDLFKDVNNTMENIEKIIVLLNAEDYHYFEKNIDKIKNIFQNKIEIQNINDEIIGGFKILLNNGLIFYDYSLNKLIDMNLSLIQIEFSKIITDFNIKNLETNFSDYIKNKKSKIKEYLADYDRI